MITTPKTLLIFNFLKCGIADSTKEANIIAVNKTKSTSRKNQIKKKPSATKKNLIIVPVDI